MTAPALQRRAWLSAGLAATAIMSACQTTAFEQHLKAGRWRDAADLFEADSALQRDPRTLARAAHLYTDPDSSTWNPARALTLFQQSREANDGKALDPPDARMEAVLRSWQQARVARERQVFSLEDSLRGARADVQRISAEYDRLSERASAADEERALLRRLVARLEGELREREAQVVLLQTELDRLKAIDLGPAGRAPPGARTGPDTTRRP